jgi:hypothetical protein
MAAQKRRGVVKTGKNRDFPKIKLLKTKGLQLRFFGRAIVLPTSEKSLYGAINAKSVNNLF